MRSSIDQKKFDVFRNTDRRIAALDLFADITRLNLKREDKRDLEEGVV